MSSALVLVVGSTGFLGSEVARQLRAAGHAVRALVRTGSDPMRVSALRSIGAQIVVGDLRDPTSIATACEGVGVVVSTATSLMSTAPGDSIETVDLRGQLELVAAAESAKARQFVFVSFPATKTDHAFQRAKRAVESRLRESRLSHTIFHSASFAEVWLSPFLGFDPLNGQARIFGDGKALTNWISLTDVARFVVAAVDDAAFLQRTLTLGGPDALSYLDVVALFADSGVDRVSLEHVPESTLEAQLQTVNDSRQEAFAAAMLGRARAQLVSSDDARALRPLELARVKDFVARLVAGAKPS